MNTEDLPIVHSAKAHLRSSVGGMAKRQISGATGTVSSAMALDRIIEKSRVDTPSVGNRNLEPINTTSAPPTVLRSPAPLSATIPDTLKAVSRWVVWKYCMRDKGGKPTKVPYCPTLINTCASSTDPATWGTFQQAETSYDEGGYDGIGIVLDGDGIVGVDIDDCIENGVIKAEATMLMNSLGVEYYETSPSGNGLRGFGYAESLEKGVNGVYNGLKVELYSWGRFLTVTGDAVQNGPLAQLTGFTDLANLIRADKKANPKTGELEQAPAAARQSELIRRIMSAEVFHDSLRDLAAIWIATGMMPGGVVNALYGLMDNAPVVHDGRWAERRAEIPSLVSSAVAKYAPSPVDFGNILSSRSGEITPDQNNFGALFSQRYKLRTAADLANAPSLKWMIRSLLPQTGLAALYGASGTGKSFLALDLAVNVAGGSTEWYGMRVTNCPVTYCVLEGEGGMGKRTKAWAQHHDKALPDELRFITQPINLLRQDDVRELAAAILAAGGGGGLIILDTLNRAAPEADENSSKDMGAIVAAAKALQVVTGGLVMVVHHTGKNSELGMRGHSSLFAAMDSVIGVTKSQWEVKKSKDDATGALYPFKLETLSLGVDDEGDEVTSCVAVPVAAAFALRQSKKLGPHQMVALDTIIGMATDFVSSIHVDKAVAAVADKLDVSNKHKRERAKAAIGALIDMGKLKTENNYVRPV